MDVGVAVGVTVRVKVGVLVGVFVLVSVVVNVWVLVEVKVQVEVGVAGIIVGVAEQTKAGKSVRALIRFCPLGVPHPVARSYPVMALYKFGFPSRLLLLPSLMSLISVW